MNQPCLPSHHAVQEVPPLHLPVCLKLPNLTGGYGPVVNQLKGHTALLLAPYRRTHKVCGEAGQTGRNNRQGQLWVWQCQKLLLVSVDGMLCICALQPVVHVGVSCCCWQGLALHATCSWGKIVSSDTFTASASAVLPPSVVVQRIAEFAYLHLL